MIDLTTHYAGLKLKSPIIAASSGMTDSMQKIQILEDSGVGAIVLKSLFEEEIIKEMENVANQMMANPLTYPDTYDMFDLVDDKNSVQDYLDLIREAKSKTSVPLIASINCQSDQKWIYFSKKIQNAGADALELNMFIMPSDFDKPNTADIERTYFSVVNEVCRQVSIPVTIKISSYFSNLGPFLQQLSQTRIKGMVLFNRFFAPDYDLDTLDLIPSFVLSTPADIQYTLRWMAIMYNRVDCDLAASTGVHDGNGVIKQILAGANATQIASTLYKNGPAFIKTMHEQIISFMKEREFSKIDDFRGLLSQKHVRNPASFERVQFIKNFRNLTS
ncbi:MAG: dihydroorotate dehydrogenase-like protein [Bacteroidales bacterium]